MNAFLKLRRAFYNAMPVIGPHADIECELLLAGRKPLGWLRFFPDNAELETWRLKKEHRDRKILDQAVAKGQLRSIDSTNYRPDHISLRYYCQPGREEDMMAARGINEDNQDIMKACKKDWDQLLGYRRRDVIFFNNYASLPEPITNLCIQLNSRAQAIHREEQLKECGIDPQKWVAQLRAENIIP